MAIASPALWLLAQETRALLTRLDRVKPFALYETMIPAAAPSLPAQTAIERYLADGRRDMRRLVAEYLTWLQRHAAQGGPVSEAQCRFSFLRLRFNAVLSQFDIFADVMTQRSEHENGIWLAGLDVLAADALALPRYYESPPVICYLDRGHGAAIRRARTRLPGGGENPAAIIRVPRERMVSNGIASSLVHEVGHQGAALLGLVNSLRQSLNRLQSHNGYLNPWVLFSRWISEIVADFWSVAKVGIASTLGLMGVVSLPRVFVFRTNLDDPHPIPWIRVKLSCAMGQALYPHPQWSRLDAMWEQYYPLSGLNSQSRQVLTTIETCIPEFITLLVNHRPLSLRGQTLGKTLAAADRQPERLRDTYRAWQLRPEQLRRAPPALVFAAIGQARADGTLSPEVESRLLGELLTHWALRRTLNAAALCTAQAQPMGIALAV